MGPPSTHRTLADPDRTALRSHAWETSRDARRFRLAVVAPIAVSACAVRAMMPMIPAALTEPTPATESCRMAVTREIAPSPSSPMSSSSDDPRSRGMRLRASLQQGVGWAAPPSATLPNPRPTAPARIFPPPSGWPASSTIGRYVPPRRQPVRLTPSCAPSPTEAEPSGGRLADRSPLVELSNDPRSGLARPPEWSRSG